MMPFSTYIGGSKDDLATAVATGPDGTVWIAGYTYSSDFPGFPSGGPPFPALRPTLFHIDPSSHVVLSYLMLDSWIIPRRLAVDAGGDVFILGTGGWTVLPGAPGFQPTSAGYDDLTVTRVAVDGRTVLWSTYLGGSNEEYAGDIAVGTDGNLVVTGATRSADFPTTDSLQPSSGGGMDAFVVRIRGDGSELMFSSYLGGSANDFASGIAIALDGGIVVCGSTRSEDFPTAGSIQLARRGGDDGFVIRMDPTGSTLEWTTVLAGESRDSCTDVAVDRDGAVVLLGSTLSDDFPAAEGPTWAADGMWDLFLARLAADGSVQQPALRFGGRLDDWPAQLAIAPDGTAWVAGETGSDDLPTAGSVRCRKGYGPSAFAAGFDLESNELLFSTYLGGNSWTSAVGIALGADDSAWIVGDTLATNLPLASPLQPLNAGVRDMFAAQFLRTDPEGRPGSPDALHATALSGHSVRLDWGDQSTNEAGFAVDRRGELYSFDRIAVLAEGTGAFEDFGVLPARTYTYSVQAFNGEGGSLPTAAVGVTTPPTLDFRLLRWRQREIPWRTGNYRIRFLASIRPEPGASRDRLDPIDGGVELRIESEEYTGYLVLHSIPPDDDHWRRSGQWLRWRNRYERRFNIRVNPRRGLIEVRDLTSERLPITIPGQDVRTRITVGTDAGAGLLPWPVDE